MTNAIGSGTVNIAVNVPRDERDLLGQIAFRSGARSVGAFLRRCVAEQLEREDPASAARLRQIRRQYYGAAFCFIAFAVGLICNERQDYRARIRGRRAERIEEVREV